ncbi:WYL domain-containing protein [Thauera aromatica]|uniref:WYL domain-containing protein n=1 Tax=Thauera aromatica TaxID=59405 RepID=UPI001FFC8980|nr:WYL domain-containing protein [Thauera aromatica]MCK2095210.1 WYL domain-containing protein [Thauera aromatica]
MPRLDLHNRCVELEYVDADGTVTRRKVNLNVGYRSVAAVFWYAEGFCHLRRERRTFRSDRMLRLFDGRGNWSLAADPSGWFESLWLSSPEGGYERQRQDRRAEREAEAARYLAEQQAREQMEEEARSIVGQHFHALRALLYVAKADKAFRSAEKRLFAFFFKRVAGHRMNTGELEARCIKMAMEIDLPTTGQFHYSARQLAPLLRTYRMAVCATAKAMINTDKKVAPYELEVLDYLVRKLRPLDD